jgi:hypothetical protein
VSAEEYLAGALLHVDAIRAAAAAAAGGGGGGGGVGTQPEAGAAWHAAAAAGCGAGDLEVVAAGLRAVQAGVARHREALQAQVTAPGPG